jgi:hypothetical protein
MAEDMSAEADSQIDFESFMQFAKSADWEGIRRVLALKTTKPDDFFAVIPPGVAQFALILRTPWIFEALQTQAPDSVQEKLRSAKAIVDERFGGIEEHPLATKFAQDRVQRAISTVGKTDTNLLAEFSGFEATPIWLETKSGLIAASVVTLKGERDRTLFSETLAWDELSFLAFVFADLLKAEFGRAAKMADSQSINIPHRESLSRRLEQMAGVVADLRKIGDSLGIKHSATSDPVTKG